jgi:alkylmercury lyase
MEKLSPSEIAKMLRQSGIPPHFEPDQSRLLIQVWRLVADGRPVPPGQIEQIASNLRMPLDEATSFINRVSERDSEGNIVGTVGLSQKKHPHMFEVDGRALATWCAWDSLFLPLILKQTARVESYCPATEKKIRLTITPERVEQYEPASVVVSMVTPKLQKKGLKNVEDAWMIFCNHVHFFDSHEVASKWLSGRNLEPIVLSVEESYQLGRMAFEELLKYV